MTSRHGAGLIVVSRDDVESFFPFAEHVVRRPGVSGRGHLQNLRFWLALSDRPLTRGWRARSDQPGADG
jgi:hypothetical protein